MKYLLLLLITLFAAPLTNAHAESESPAACPSFVSCGTYVGLSDAEDRASLVTTVTITPESHNKVILQYKLDDGTESTSWWVKMSFAVDGTFQLFMNGQFWANGSCAGEICSFAVRPQLKEDKSPAGSGLGMLRFRDGGQGLDLHLMFASSEDNSATISRDVARLKKQ